jgi:hypothetical protein
MDTNFASCRNDGGKTQAFDSAHEFHERRQPRETAQVGLLLPGMSAKTCSRSRARRTCCRIAAYEESDLSCWSHLDNLMNFKVDAVLALMDYGE